MINAKWFPVNDEPGFYRAACGIQGCCPEMAAAKKGDTGHLAETGKPLTYTLYAMRAGLTIDRDTTDQDGRLNWSLSGKAKDQWVAFQTAGGKWNDFRPEGRHYYQNPLTKRLPWLRDRYTPRERGMQHFPVEENCFPLVVRCPFCGWNNLLGPA